MKVKKIISFFFLTALFWVKPFAQLSSQEALKVPLQAPAQWLLRACPSPLWKDLRIGWKGVRDLRGRKEIGEKNGRKKDSAPVFSEKPLEELFEENLKIFFTHCGMILSPSSPDSRYELSVEIEEFFGVWENKIVTSKGVGSSRLVFLLENPKEKKRIEVGYQIESKKVRKSAYRGIGELLNELFAKTLEQVSLSQPLREIR